MTACVRSQILQLPGQNPEEVDWNSSEHKDRINDFEFSRIVKKIFEFVLKIRERDGGKQGSRLVAWV